MHARPAPSTHVALPKSRDRGSAPSYTCLMMPSGLMTQTNVPVVLPVMPPSSSFLQGQGPTCPLKADGMGPHHHSSFLHGQSPARPLEADGPAVQRAQVEQHQRRLAVEAGHGHQAHMLPIGACGGVHTCVGSGQRPTPDASAAYNCIHTCHMCGSWAREPGAPMLPAEPWRFFNPPPPNMLCPPSMVLVPNSGWLPMKKTCGVASRKNGSLWPEGDVGGSIGLGRPFAFAAGADVGGGTGLGFRDQGLGWDRRR